MKTYREILGEIMAPLLTGQQTLFVVSVSENGRYLSGIESGLFFNDADVNVEISCLAAEYYGVMADPSWDLYNFEARAMGQKIRCAETGLPDIDQTTPLIKSEADLDKIKWPGDPLKSGHVPLYLQSLELMQNYTGMPPKMYNGIASPFSIACGICSYSGLMGFVRRKSDLAHEILHRIVDDITIPYIKAISAKYPGIMVKCSDAWEMVPNVSPKIQQEYGFNYYDRVREGVKDSDVSVEWWVAYSEKYFPDPAVYIKDKLKYNSTIFVSGTETDTVPLTVYRDAAIANNAPLWVALPSIKILNGPPEAIVESIRELAKQSKPGVTNSLYGLVMAVPFSTPPEHVMAAVASSRAFSVLPVPDDFDSIKVEIPPIKESFGDFVRRKHAENPDGYTFKWLDKAIFYGE